MVLWRVFDKDETLQNKSYASSFSAVAVVLALAYRGPHVTIPGEKALNDIASVYDVTLQECTCFTDQV